MGQAFRTTVIGSYLRRDTGALRRPTLAGPEAEEAIRWAVGEQVSAGMDIVTDGEQRRESLVTFFQHRTPGFSFDRPVTKTFGDGHTVQVPRVVDKVSYGRLGLAGDWQLARACAPPHVEVKVTCTGPHMLAKFALNEAYPSDEELAMDIAACLNRELREVVASGCRFVQIDEPQWTGNPEEMAWAARALNRAVEGLGVPVGLHVCFGNPLRRRIYPRARYHDLLDGFRAARVDQVLLESCTHPYDVLTLFDVWPFQGELALGVVDVKSDAIESPELIAERARRALKCFPPERLLLTSECGYIYCPRDVAYGKMQALAAAARWLRRELGAGP